MSKQTIRRIHLIYAVVMSLLIATVGILLIVSCLNIYKSGSRPFSAESVGVQFARIAPLVYLCLIWMLGGLVLTATLPPERRKLKSSASPDAALKRLSCKLDMSACPADIAYGIRKQQRLRRVLCIVAVALYLIGSALALIYVLNPSNFPAVNANVEIRTGAIALLVNLALPFAYSLVLVFINKAGVKQELTLVKQAIAAQAKASVSPVTQPQNTACPIRRAKAFFSKHNKKILAVTRCTVLLVGLVLVIIGILNGGAFDVVQKAIKICTECIGLG